MPEYEISLLIIDKMEKKNIEIIMFYLKLQFVKMMKN